MNSYVKVADKVEIAIQRAGLAGRAFLVTNERGRAVYVTLRHYEADPMRKCHMPRTPYNWTIPELADLIRAWWSKDLNKEPQAVLDEVAQNRVKASPALAPHYDAIFADWDEPDHITWLLKASEAEILDWLASFQGSEEDQE